MKNVALAICAAAAALYIGQWAWSFKTEADERDRAIMERADKLVRDNITQE